MDRAAFITVEDGDDLIVSFAVVDREPGDVQSVTLLRTPKYEALMTEAKRGVGFSDERSPQESDAMLRELRVEASTVVMKTDLGSCMLDLSGVDSDELAEAKRILSKMNFDNGFVLSLE